MENGGGDGAKIRWNPSLETNSHSASQVTPRLLRNPSVH